MNLHKKKHFPQELAKVGKFFRMWRRVRTRTNARKSKKCPKRRHRYDELQKRKSFVGRLAGVDLEEVILSEGQDEQEIHSEEQTRQA